MRVIYFILVTLASASVYADVYDDFVEDYIVKEPKEKLVKRYKDQPLPEGYTQAKWEDSTNKLIEKINKDLGKGGSIFSSISQEYRNNFSPADMSKLIDIISNPAYQDIMKKNRAVKSNVSEAIQSYVFEDLMEKAYEIRSQD